MVLSIISEISYEREREFLITAKYENQSYLQIGKTLEN